MGTIKLQQNVLNGAGAKVSPIVSNNESARQKARNVSSAMYDMSFSSRDALIGELRSIEQRLGKQTERIQQYGKMIHTICDELNAADRASATDAKNLNTRISAISGAGETVLSLSTAVSLERIQQIAGTLLLPGYAIGCGIGRRLRDWIERIFSGHSSGSGLRGNSHAAHFVDSSSGGDKPGKTDTAPVQLEPVAPAEPPAPQKTELEQKVDEMKYTEGFEEGTLWGNDDKYGGWESCAAMAIKMQTHCLGREGVKQFENENAEHYTPPADLKPGDVVHCCWYEYDPDKQQERGRPYMQHYFFVYKIEGSTIHYGEGNYVTDTGDRIVHYGQADFSEFGRKIYDASTDSCSIEGGRWAIQEIWR